MPYKYCDWTSGSDLTGDGTASLPYKSIEKALETLTGGDEVRVAKSAAHTLLSGTFAFVDGSASITTSVSQVGTVAPNDLIGKDDDDLCWWQVANVVAGTITLSTVYSGTTETVAAYKMGAHDLGAATSTTQVLDRTNGRDGTSLTSRLKISGGWNLSTELQDGETFFKQSGASIYGIGFQLTGTSNYIEIEKLHYARCYYGINIQNASMGFYIHDVGFYRPYRGIYMLSQGLYSRFGGTIRISQATDRGIYFYYNNAPNEQIDGDGCTIEARSCNIGFQFSTGNSYWTKIFTHRCTYGLYIDYGSNYRVAELEVHHATYGLYIDYYATEVTIGKYSPTSVTTAIRTGYNPVTIQHYIPSGIGTDVTSRTGSDGTFGIPIAKFQRWGNDNYSGRMYFKGIGWVYQDNANARATRCIRFSPTVAGFGLYWPVGTVKCMNTNLDMTLSVYMKHNGFSGNVYMAAIVLGKKVTGWTEKIVTTSYVQYSIVVPHAELVLTEYVDLQVRVSGTSGNVYVDDFSVTQ